MYDLLKTIFSISNDIRFIAPKSCRQVLGTMLLWCWELFNDNPVKFTINIAPLFNKKYNLESC